MVIISDRMEKQFIGINSVGIVDGIRINDMLMGDEENFVEGTAHYEFNLIQRP